MRLQQRQIGHRRRAVGIEVAGDPSAACLHTEVFGDQGRVLSIDLAVEVDVAGQGGYGQDVLAGGELILNVDSLDNDDNDFDGQITIQGGATLEVNVPGGWVSNGRLRFDTDPAAGIAEIRGTPLTIGSAAFGDELFVGGAGLGGIARIGASTEFTSAADVRVFSGTLVLNGPYTVIDGGQWSGAGELKLDATTTTIAGPTTMTVNVVDLDGVSTGADRLVINSPLTLEVDAIDDGGSNQFNDDTIEINGSGRLDIQLPVATDYWIMAGNLEFSGGGRLEGQAVRIAGSVAVDGEGIVDTTTVRFLSDAVVSVPNATDVLELRAATYYDGGTYGGQGTIVQAGEVFVISDTTIGGTVEDRLGVFDWDGAAADGAVTTISAGTRFALNVGTIDSGNPATDGFDDVVDVDGGELIVNTGYVIYAPGPLFIREPWRMEGQMNLTHTLGQTPRLAGSPMVLAGSLHASGGPADVDADSTMEDAGYLYVGPTGVLRQNGRFTQQGGGVAIAAGGRMETYDDATFGAAGSVAVAGVLELNGDTTFEGGDMSGVGTLELYGNSTVAATSTFDVETRFRASSRTDIPSARQLNVDADGVVESGAVFTGSGVLRNRAGSTLTLNDAAVVDLAVDNLGTLHVGKVIGEARVSNYRQTAAGVLVIDIEGIAAGQFDVLHVDGLTDLAGALNASAIGFDEAVLGERFTVLTFDSRSGAFDDVVGTPSASLPGLFWTIAYTRSAAIRSQQFEVCIQIDDRLVDGRRAGDDKPSASAVELQVGRRGERGVAVEAKSVIDGERTAVEQEVA